MMVSGEGSIAKPASKVMLGGVLSLFGGLAANVIVAAVFGAGRDMDAYLTALVIPAYCQIVFYSSLYFVLLPAFIDSETKEGEEAAWALVGTFFWITTLLLLTIAVIGSLFSNDIIRLIAPGFAPEKASLAARMLAVLFYSTPLMGLGTLTVGIQNSRNRFFWPSVAPGFGSTANVILILLLSGPIGTMALCWGNFGATALQAGFTIVPVVAHGWKKLLPLGDSRVRTIGRLMVPLVFFGLVVSFSPLADRYFASGLPNGQIAYMGYASKVSGIFVVVLASGIASAIFPSMARTYGQEGLPGLSGMQDFGMRLTFAVALPAIAVTAAVSVPLTGTLFERGAFVSRDTSGVSRIVFAFLLSDVLFRMMGNIFQRSFYVLKDTRTQPIISTLFVILYLLAAPSFVAHWGYVGLVWAGVTRNGLGVITLWVLLARRFPRDGLANVFRSLARYVFAALAAFLGARGALLVLAAQPEAVQLVVGAVVGGSIYAAGVYLLEKDMLRYAFALSGIPYAFETLRGGPITTPAKQSPGRGE